MAGRAQTPRPAFEVASLKPNPNCRVTGSGGPSPGRLELPCVTLRMLIRAAYGAFSGERLNTRRPDIIGGPSWMDSEQYQLTAKAEGRPSAAVMTGPMLQVLLEERFQLKLHVEARETAVLILTIAKEGKLAPAKDGSCVPIDVNNLQRPDPAAPPPKYCGGPTMRGTPRGTIADVPGATMEEFAGRMLGALAGRPVVDKTGLTGRFDLHIEFSPENRPGALLNGEPAPAMAPAADALPSIFTALQEQLGLKLSPGKAPIDVIVVDSAAKPTVD